MSFKLKYIYIAKSIIISFFVIVIFHFFRRTIFNIKIYDGTLFGIIGYFLWAYIIMASILLLKFYRKNKVSQVIFFVLFFILLLNIISIIYNNVKIDINFLRKILFESKMIIVVFAFAVLYKNRIFDNVSPTYISKFKQIYPRYILPVFILSNLAGIVQCLWPEFFFNNISFLINENLISREFMRVTVGIHIQGLFTHYNSFAHFTAINIIILYYGYIREKHASKLMYLNCLVGFLLLLFAGSRMAVLTISLIFIFELLTRPIKTRKNFYNKIIKIFMIGVLFIAIIWGGGKYSESFKRYADLAEYEFILGSARARLFYYPIKEGKTLVGFGPGRYGIPIAFSDDTYLAKLHNIGESSIYMDNQYASILGQIGILGLVVCFGLLIFMIIKYFMLKNKYSDFVLSFCLLLYCAFAAFTIPIFAMDILIGLISSNIIVSTINGEQQKKETKKCVIFYP